MTLENVENLFLKIKKLNTDNIYDLYDELNELLKLEKKRLGFNENNLVFVSAGDISKFYWCPMQTHFTLIENEVKKFAGYLKDKIEYSTKLEKYNKVPNNYSELLEIGDNLVLNDVFKLLKRVEYSNIVNENDIWQAKKNLKGCKLPIKRGHYLEIIHAKKYPKIHWFIKYKNLIFTCEPDGITDDFVYEFKSSKNRYFSKQSTLKAKLQADIYCLCFDMKKKIIDNFIISENKIESITEAFNIKNLDLVIEEMKKIIAGNLPHPPKEKFKCKSCRYKDKCVIKHS